MVDEQTVPEEEAEPATEAAAEPTPEAEIPAIEATKFKSGAAYHAWRDAGAVPGTEADFE